MGESYVTEIKLGKGYLKRKKTHLIHSNNERNSYSRHSESGTYCHL